MRKLWIKILIGVVVMISLTVLYEPFMLIIMTFYLGGRLNSIEMTWIDTYFHITSRGNSFLFSPCVVPTWHVVQWGLASIMLMTLAFAVILRWWHQTGVLDSFSRLKRDVAIAPKS